MTVFNLLTYPLRRAGEHGALALTLSLLIGLAFPALAAYVKPYLREVIILLLVSSFLRVEPDALRQVTRRPLMIILGTIWLLVAMPFILFGLFIALGLPESHPDLIVILLLMATAPPVMSAPAMAYVLGLNGAISLSVMILSMLCVPITAPIITDWLMPGLLPISALQLSGQLTIILLGSWVTAQILKLFLTPSHLSQYKTEIDGLNVFLLFFFAVSLMDGVGEYFLTQPVFAISMTLATFVLAFFQIGITLLVFAPFGREKGWPLALAVGNRNMGMMVVAIGSQMPDISWLWFALGQFPIYMLPLILTPFLAAKKAQANPASPKD